MPYQFAQVALMGVFLLVWLFIASMLLGDRLNQIRERRYQAVPRLRGSSGQPHFRVRNGLREEIGV